MIFSISSIARQLNNTAQQVRAWAKELEFTNGRIRTAEIYRDRCETALADAETRLAVVRQKLLAAKLGSQNNGPVRALDRPSSDVGVENGNTSR